MKWIMKLTIRSRLFISFTIIVILTLLLGATAVFNLQKVASFNDKMYQHSLIVIRAALLAEARGLMIQRELRSVMRDAWSCSLR